MRTYLEKCLPNKVAKSTPPKTRPSFCQSTSAALTTLRKFRYPLKPKTRMQRRQQQQQQLQLQLRRLATLFRRSLGVVSAHIFMDLESVLP